MSEAAEAEVAAARGRPATIPNAVEFTVRTEQRHRDRMKVISRYMQTSRNEVSGRVIALGIVALEAELAAELGIEVEQFRRLLYAASEEVV